MATSRPQTGKWIQKANIKPGGLHKSLGIAAGKKIPKSKIATAAKRGARSGDKLGLPKHLAR